MSKRIESVQFSYGSFEIQACEILAGGAPGTLEMFHGYIDKVYGGFQVKTYIVNRISGAVTTGQYIGDIYTNYNDVIPTFTGVFLGTLASLDVDPGSMLSYLDITAKLEEPAE